MTELRLDGKVALVTGAGRGLGREYALLLASRGASVLVNDLGADLGGDGRDSIPARQVVDEIEKSGGTAIANFGNVAAEVDARDMVAQALRELGGLHIVINNAGNFTNARPFLETSSESFQSLWQVHVMGTVNVVRAAWPHLIAQQYGRIINVGSHGGYYGHGGKFEYATVKAAIHGLTMTLAMEGSQHGVAVNVLAPGAGTRPVLSWAPADQFGGDAFAPSLVAPTAVWLAHEDCPANGQSYSTMSGNTSRIVIAETNGFQARSPTPEAIHDHRHEIVEIGDVSAANLTFPRGAVPRGAELVERFNSLQE